MVASKKKAVSKKKSSSKKKAASKARATKKVSSRSTTNQAKYPRHSLSDVLRIPTAILDQHAGKVCTDDQAAAFIGMKSSAGPTAVEISSGIKKTGSNRFRS